MIGVIFSIFVPISKTRVSLMSPNSNKQNLATLVMNKKRIKKQDLSYVAQNHKDRKKFDAKVDPQTSDSKRVERGSIETSVTYGESENDYL